MKSLIAMYFFDKVRQNMGAGTIDHYESAVKDHNSPASPLRSVLGQSQSCNFIQQISSDQGSLRPHTPRNLGKYIICSLSSSTPSSIGEPVMRRHGTLGVWGHKKPVTIVLVALQQIRLDPTSIQVGSSHTRFPALRNATGISHPGFGLRWLADFKKYQVDMSHKRGVKITSELRTRRAVDSLWIICHRWVRLRILRSLAATKVRVERYHSKNFAPFYLAWAYIRKYIPGLNQTLWLPLAKLSYEYAYSL